MEILQIIMICLCATIFIVVLEKQKEFGIYLSILASIIVFFMFADQLQIVLDLMYRMNSFLNLDDVYMKILFQILGVAFVSEFGSGICKDAGQKALATNIEIAGKIIILVIAAPIVMAIFNLIEGVI